jgi:hypothetical protein
VEIRCDNCSHVGPAAEVRPGAGGVVLVCENCEHENVLDVGETTKNAEASDASKAEIPQTAELDAPHKEPAGAGSFESNDQVRMWLREDALKALIPEPGVGPRCRKCAQLLSPHADNCTRCGLNRDEAERHAPGEAPWERAPQGKESEKEQAELLWESFAEDPSSQSLQKFVDFVRDEGLLDLGIRKLRFYLVDHPDDDEAVGHLRDLAESLQSKLIVAQVQARASADSFQEDVSRFRNRMLIGTLVFWGGIFLLFLMFFWDNCASGIPNF